MRIHIIGCGLRPLSLSAGLLWELRPLLHRPEPAAPSHRGPLHPPAAAGLAHPHRHEDGAARVHEQVHLRCPRVFWPLTLHSDPTRVSVAKKRNISSRLIPPSPSPHLVDFDVLAAFVNEVLEDLTVKKIINWEANQRISIIKRSNQMCLFQVYYYSCKHGYSRVVTHSFVGLCFHVK